MKRSLTRLALALVWIASPGPTAADESAVLVATRSLESQRYDLTLPVKLGLLEASEQRVLAFEVTGRLAWIAPEGGSVRQGGGIAQLGSRLEEANLRKARLRVAEAEQELERVQGLLLEGATSTKARDRAETELALRRAEAEAASEQLDRRRVEAPFTGVITETSAEPGEIVSPGAPVAVLMHLDTLRLRVGVPGYQVARARPGARVVVEVPSGNGPVEGRVKRVADAAPEGRHLFEVEIMVPNQTRALRPGMSARARIVTETLEESLVVPLEAMVERHGARVVFFADGGRARAVDVGDAPLHGNTLLLPAALPHRELVVRGQRDLSDGIRIRVGNAVLEAEVSTR